MEDEIVGNVINDEKDEDKVAVDARKHFSEKESQETFQFQFYFVSESRNINK